MSLNFFEKKSFLYLNIYTSSKSSQISNDSGEGRGSVWTNFFIAKGKMNPSYGKSFGILEKK